MLRKPSTVRCDHTECLQCYLTGQELNCKLVPQNKIFRLRSSTNASNSNGESNFCHTIHYYELPISYKMRLLTLLLQLINKLFLYKKNDCHIIGLLYLIVCRIECRIKMP